MTYDTWKSTDSADAFSEDPPTPCGDCGGSGGPDEAPCDHCHGSGEEQ